VWQVRIADRLRTERKFPLLAMKINKSEEVELMPQLGTSFFSTNCKAWHQRHALTIAKPQPFVDFETTQKTVGRFPLQ
jgi:hypothetical protein